MENIKKAKSALISVFNKDGLEPIVRRMNELGIVIYSTGGTQNYIKSLGFDVIAVESLTQYPSILGGRVKTLHPKVFGGILNRRSNEDDQRQLKQYDIPPIDIVVVDLYPFEKTVSEGAGHDAIIEKIDIGGISLIRSAAKNYKDVLCISSIDDYAELYRILMDKEGCSSIEERRALACKGFMLSSHYDTAIFNYFNKEHQIPSLKISQIEGQVLRYGENPHQKGAFYGDFEALFDKLNGKELSYNNLLDIDSAVNLIREFKDNDPTFAILKHNNACGVATRNSVAKAYLDALSCDPVSAFGGVLISNRPIDEEAAVEINKLFCEVVIAPSFSGLALDTLKEKKNRIILKIKDIEFSSTSVRTCLNGYLFQDKDLFTDTKENFTYITKTKPTQREIDDLIFALKICKNTKSNTIVLAKDGKLVASGTGQTSRVDALKQAIDKAREFNLELEGAVMASDAFFPFPDCVEIAHKAGITSVIQPGGSIKDNLSIEYCNANSVSMVMTGVRHFKH